MREEGPSIAYEFISSVKEQLRTKNRFSVDCRVDKLIELYVKEESNTSYLKPPDILYRARIYKNDDAISRFNAPPEGRFKGYNSKDSFVNLEHNLILEGRCNPTFIPYLYTSTSPDCCIYEVRPQCGAYVSVARIKVKEKLKILRLDRRSNLADENMEIVQGVLNSTLCLYLSEEFARPHKNDGVYLLCQYVSEKIKNFGFDGISTESSVFPKSLHPDSDHSFTKLLKRKTANVVVFSYEKCKAISSDMYIVGEVCVDFKKAGTL